MDRVTQSSAASAEELSAQATKLREVVGERQRLAGDWAGATGVKAMPTGQRPGLARRGRSAALANVAG